MNSMHILMFLVCLINIHHVPETILLIIKEAFSPNSNLYEIQLCGHSCLDENAEDIYKEVAKELADFLKKD